MKIALGAVSLLSLLRVTRLDSFAALDAAGDTLVRPSKVIPHK